MHRGIYEIPASAYPLRMGIVKAVGCGFAGLSLLTLACSLVSGQVPKPDHVVICIMENHGYGQIIGSAQAPYLSGLANDSAAALFTQSFALTHPSQPNYLMLFSGSNQGIIDDKVPAKLPFTTANLGAELRAKGFGFAAYSEDLPSEGFTGATSAKYARKHAPWVNWQGTAANGLPGSLHMPFSAFPYDYATLPTVTFVIPNLISDMHDGTVPQGDAWVKKNLDPYVQWAKAHNSLFILTFDEDDGGHANQISTLFVGQMVKKGKYAERITHYNVLRTLEDMYGLDFAGAAATAAAIKDCWKAAAVSARAPLPAPALAASAAPELRAVNGAYRNASVTATQVLLKLK